MSIKLTKMYTIRYIQGPNNYFAQSLRHFVDVDMDLGVRRRLDSGGRWVQSPQSWWARRSTDAGSEISPRSLHTPQLSVFTCGRTGNQYVVSLSSPRCHVHHVYRVYSSFIVPLPVIKKLRPSSSERRLHRLSKHHVLYHWVRPTKKGQSVQQIDFARVSMRMNPLFRAKKVYQNRAHRGRIHVVNRMIDNRTTCTKYRT